MTVTVSELLSQYWSAQEVSVNLIVFANLFGALLLGLVVGYERAYHGRAAGMRTYGLVCLASCALVVVAGYPAFWYGGGAIGAVGSVSHVPADPTRVIQGVVTGIGFLGAGVILKEGLNISGLTTAASIWSSSVIGVLVGVGFYASAILLALLSAGLMMWASKLEQWLPSRPAVAVQLKFCRGVVPRKSVLAQFALEQGYEIASGTLQIHCVGDCEEWRFVASALNRKQGATLSALSHALRQLDGVGEYSLGYARN